MSASGFCIIRKTGDWGECYLPWPSVVAVNTIHNSSDNTKAESNNILLIIILDLKFCELRKMHKLALLIICVM